MKKTWANGETPEFTLIVTDEVREAAKNIAWKYNSLIERRYSSDGAIKDMKYSSEMNELKSAVFDANPKLKSSVTEDNILLEKYRAEAAVQIEDLVVNISQKQGCPNKYPKTNGLER